MRRHRRRAVLAGSAALPLLAVGPASAEPAQLPVDPTGSCDLTGDPAKFGAWSAPFEEGNVTLTRCHRVQNSSLPDEIVCKPAAVNWRRCPTAGSDTPTASRPTRTSGSATGPIRGIALVPTPTASST